MTTRLPRVHASLLALALVGCGGPGKPRAPVVAAADTATIEALERTIPATGEADEIVLRMPRVTVPGNPAATARINETLGVPATAELLEDQGDVGRWFDVRYNQRGLLSMTVTRETLGAYLDSEVEYFVFDLTSGARVEASAVFRPDALPQVLTLVDGKLQAELTEARAVEGDCAADELGPELYQRTATADELHQLWINAQGQVVFDYPFDFPHAIQACEPTGTYAFTAGELSSTFAATSPLLRLAQ